LADNELTEEEALRALGHSSVTDWMKARAEAQYVTDIKPPGMLIDKVLRSAYPHAEIVGTVASRAGEVLGVKAVTTSWDKNLAITTIVNK